jgi:hypothetical protein
MKLLSFLWLMLSFSILLADTAAIELPNPSFEFDTYGIGVPDGWKIPESTAVKLVGNPVSDGGKAAYFTSGYVLVSHEWKIAAPAGIRLRGSFDAAGNNGARIGLLIGFNREQDGKKRFVTSRVFWDRESGAEYKRFTFDYQVPPNAAGDRLYFAVYRSNKQGEVYLDNFELAADRAGATRSAEDKKRYTALLRDYEYAREKGLSTPGAEHILKIISAKIDLLEKATGNELEKIQADTSLGDINASLNKRITGRPMDASWSDAYLRLDKGRTFPAEAKYLCDLLSLENEYQALGIIVANGESSEVELPVAINGIERFGDEVELRRQVFMMNWYQRERTLTADPLPLLPRKDGNWLLKISPGETVKLYLSFKVKEKTAGKYRAEVTIGERVLTADVTVRDHVLPTEPAFGHMQFIYANREPAASHPELAALDLKKHYVTTIEFAFMPKAAFTAHGEIASIDLEGSPQEKWMKAYGGQGLELGIFWQPSYKRFKIKDSDQYIPYVDEKNQLTPEWKRAFAGLMATWLGFAEKSGYGKYMTMLPVDEPSSRDEFANAPGSLVLNAQDVCRYLREIAPGLPLMVTGSNYTLPQDMNALLPEMDLVLPHWPLPETLKRWAPPGYDPRKEFLEKTLPALLDARKTRGVRLWSYHVEGGKKETPQFEYCYPMGALGIGLTGVGTWAYNVIYGKSWDDTDGKILDYSFIYNGLENHPLNKEYNPAREVIVPSIRFKALRMGIQNARILLSLQQKMEEGKLKPETAAQVKEILGVCHQLGKTAQFDYEKMRMISNQLRNIYE